MIKFSKIYINPITVAMLVVCYIMRRLEIFYITYAIMTLHELSHFAAAKMIGLKISYIAFHPFGVNLKLKNKLICRLSDEIILYMAGPCCNILLACASLVFLSSCHNQWLYFFYISNVMLFCANMLPIVPLDGGIVLKKLLMYRIGYKQAGKIMTVVSVCIVCALTALGIYVLYVTHFNYSILFLSVFLLGNIFTQKEKYNVDYVKELMFYERKNSKRIRHHISSLDEDYRITAKKFNAGTYSVVYYIDKNGKISKTMTEREIIDKILK
ncbi:MAG: site-2 protease family protein [Clostridia bacterium]